MRFDGFGPIWGRQGYGDYTLRMRAPHETGSNPTVCDSGIYGYWTAGYVGHPQWNEMNFGFHPDRDDGGTKVPPSPPPSTTTATAATTTTTMRIHTPIPAPFHPHPCCPLAIPPTRADP